jgi:hypothetical protein
VKNPLLTLVGIVLAAAVWSTGCGPQGCPTALLSGQLVEIGGSLVVRTPTGEVAAVDWSNYSLRRQGGDLVVTDFWGTVLAREGQLVNLGGGESGPGDARFRVCGQIDVDGS